MNKLLIIGGTGTISFPITKKLASDSRNEVTILNRGSKNSELPSNVLTVLGDINDKVFVKEWLADKEFDSVINFIVWNKENALDNIELFSDHTKQFIYVSTVAVLNHEISCTINEGSEIGNNYSSYGQQKAMAEAAFLEAKETANFPVTIVRPTQTYSKERIPLSVKGKNCWSVVSRMLREERVIIHGDGQSVWASTHADDFAEGFYPIVANRDSVGEIYHIMNPESHTWDMVYQELADQLGVEYKPVYIPTDLLKKSQQYNLMQSIQGDKRWSNVFNISKIKQINPDFEPKISLKDGLGMYLDYMEAHPDLKIEDPEFDQWCDQTILLYETLRSHFVQEFK